MVRKLIIVLMVAMACACGNGTTQGPIDAAPEPDGPPVPSQWETLPDVASGPIQEIGVAELGGRIYIVGGFNGELGIVDEVWAFDIAARTWQRRAPLPMPVHHANVAAAGGKLYVLGALTGGTFQETGASWAYDPALDEWATLAPMAAEYAAGAGATGVINGKIYVVGGYRDGVSVADLSLYDPQTNTWDHTLPPLPEARDHLVGAAVGGVVYAISGRTGGISGIRGRVDAYDPTSNQWTGRAPIPTPRGGMAAGVVDGQIIVVGGEGSDAPSGVFAEVESYDPVGNTWKSLEPMRTPRHGMGAAGYEGTLYVPGGATRAGFQAVATFEALTPQ